MIPIDGERGGYRGRVYGMRVTEFVLSRRGNSPARRARPKRTAFGRTFTVSAVALCVIAVAQGATASDSSAGTVTATAYQNKVLDAAMAHVPGGTRVSASEVEWDGGSIILGVSAPAAQNSPTGEAGYGGGLATDTLSCAFDYFCAWGEPNQAGGCWMYIYDIYPNWWFNWGQYASEQYCGDPGTWSWLNDTGDRVWKEQGHTGGSEYSPYVWDGGAGTGSNWCISPHVGNNDVTDRITRTLGWIQVTLNGSKCPPGS